MANWSLTDKARTERQNLNDAYDLQVSNAWKEAPPTGEGSEEFGDMEEGDLCTINGFAGTLQKVDGELRCVPDNKGQDARSVKDARTRAYLDYDRYITTAWAKPKRRWRLSRQLQQGRAVGGRSSGAA